MKKSILISIGLIVALLCAYFVGSGFVKASSVYISDFAVSDDGTEMTVTVGVASSAGFVRKVAVYQQQGGKLYLDCYSAFGGFNGSIGAKSEYTIPLDDDTEMIAIYSGDYCYKEVLRKDDSGEWQRVK